MHGDQNESPLSRLVTPAVDAERAKFITQSQAEGFRIIEIKPSPGIPIIVIENPFFDTPLHQVVELPYETPEDQGLVEQARGTYVELMEKYGPENVRPAKPSLAVALEHGKLFPNDLIVFMVRTEPIA